MPLFESEHYPSLPVRSFRSLIFDPSLEVILESEGQVKPPKACDVALLGSINNLDFTSLKRIIKEKKGFVQVNPCFSVDLDKKEMEVRGYELHSFGGGMTYICSSNADWITIHYTFPSSQVITALEYLYHFATCV
jgi:hypothetical protein